MQTILNIGDKITFTLMSGETETGEVTGRNWAFETLLSYQVRAGNGKRYSVNLSFEAGWDY